MANAFKDRKKRKKNLKAEAWKRQYVNLFKEHQQLQMDHDLLQNEKDWQGTELKITKSDLNIHKAREAKRQKAKKKK